MVRNVLVKIRKDQQKLEHPVALLRIWISRALFQILYDRQRIGEQPLQIAWVQLLALVRSFQRFICAEKCFVEKMVQAKSLARESLRKIVCTPWPAALCVDSDRHDSPRGLGTILHRGTCRRD
jgi:hypothetical protein